MQRPISNIYIELNNIFYKGSACRTQEEEEDGRSSNSSTSTRMTATQRARDHNTYPHQYK